jgi:hypothetical protein
MGQVYAVSPDGLSGQGDVLVSPAWSECRCGDDMSAGLDLFARRVIRGGVLQRRPKRTGYLIKAILNAFAVS